VADPFVGEIRIFCGNFAPRGWAFCQGQLLPIAQNTALFSLLGTQYGGDGESTFALPDLRGRFPMFWGQGPGLSVRTIGDRDGSDAVALVASEMPAHTHALGASAAAASSTSPAGALLAASQTAVYGAGADPVPLSGQTLGAAGSGAPHENRQPFLALDFIIALQGVFPPRS
jgi:microcystin-dependent protein